MMQEQAPYDHNKPPELVGLERLHARRAELAATSSAWLTQVNVSTIDGQEQADAVKGFLDQVRALKDEAIAARDAELEPHKVATANIREAYKPIIDGALLLIDMLRPLQTAVLQRIEARKRAEADRIAREAREARERAEAEVAKAQELIEGADRGAFAGDPNAPNIGAQIIKAEDTRRAAEAREKEAAAAERNARARAGGGYGTKAASLTSMWLYSVSDVGAALAYFASCKPRPKELAEVCEKLARRMHTADRSIEIPGIEITHEVTSR
jgi:hypothetical protein